MITAKVRRRSPPLNAYKIEHKTTINSGGREVDAFEGDWVIIDENGIHNVIEEREFTKKYELLQITYRPSM